MFTFTPQLGCLVWQIKLRLCSERCCFVAFEMGLEIRSRIDRDLNLRYFQFELNSWRNLEARTSGGATACFWWVQMRMFWLQGRVSNWWLWNWWNVCIFWDPACIFPPQCLWHEQMGLEEGNGFSFIVSVVRVLRLGNLVSWWMISPWI